MRAPFCLRCKNFIGYDDILDADTWKCSAFPDGIPYERYSGINDDNCQHCNNGIGFEQTEPDQDKTA